ncbi:MAG: DUF1549 domain-containing protein [Myxococcales bacterium]|nr:DUF1549 domain-containing protein [Myxococcales bacterium]
MVIALTLLACDKAEDPAVTPASELDAEELLVRASLDLRGVRPTTAELDRVSADPSAYDALVDEFLADPRFEDRATDLFAEVFLTRTETFNVRFDGFDLTGISYYDMLRAVGEEAPRIVAHTAADDLPITEIVTGDWTMADPTTARLWPVDYPAGTSGWQQVRWTDGRPPAGVLAANSFYWRYPSTDSNANRKRANQISRILLCHDYLTRPIDFDRNVNLLDSEAIDDALHTNPGCIACHASLDPLAAYLFGFWTYEFTASEVSNYHPARERQWQDYLGTSPAYYGQPGSDLSDLGWQIAADERFPQCLVEHVTEGLLRRDVGVDDADRLTEHREALISSGLKLKPVFASVVRSPEYKAAGAPKMATTDLLADQVEDLTGFRWLGMDGRDLLRTDQQGFQTLGGGADGVFVTRAASAPNATILLVQERLAEGAAAYVVEHDVLEPSSARLFTAIDFTETTETDRDAMVAQVQALHRRIFGHQVDADSAEVEANLGLWDELYALDHDTTTAWSGVLTALLRDPDFLLY